MEMTISKLLAGQLPRLKTGEESCNNWEAEHPYEAKIPLVEKATYIGVECEIENITTETYKGTTGPYWMRTKDGSLRDNGIEFITIPLKVSRLEQALDTLFNTILKPGYRYSDRCSTHVHMNVRTLTLKQLESLVLTYMVFEKALFNWVGQNRDHNIFCVPLYNITYTNSFYNSLVNIRNMDWQKYTALNLLPILQKGTIEFRHLYGTNDIPTIMLWVNFLLCLKKFALKNQPDYIIMKILTLNTTSQYVAFLHEVFNEYAPKLEYPLLNKDMSFCISNIKAQCLAKEKKAPHPKLIEFIERKHKNKGQIKRIYQQEIGALPPVENAFQAQAVRFDQELTDDILTTNVRH